MDVAVFRLSKKDRRAGEVIHYTLPDGHVTVKAGPAGMASVWDYDLVLMAVSHLTEAMNRYREGKGEKPGRVFRPHVADVLKFCRRADGGKQADDLVETCIRLNTTHVAVQRTRKAKNGRTVTVSEGEALISRYKVIKSESGKPEYIEIELADWMYREITEGKNPDVLTVHPDYFLIDPGIGRFRLSPGSPSGWQGCKRSGLSRRSTSAAAAPARSRSSAASCATSSRPTTCPSTSCARKPGRAARCWSCLTVTMRNRACPLPVCKVRRPS
jgi:hypothetical protein